MTISKKEKHSYIAKNLLFLRKKSGKTLEEMASLLSLKSKSSYKAYEDNAIPDIHKLMFLASFYDVTLENLVYKDIETIKPKKIATDLLYEVELVPVKIAAGYAKSFGDWEYIDKLKKIRIPFKPYGIARAFQIDGDSMEPEIKNGNMVVGIKIHNGEIKDKSSYIVVTNDGPQCKNIRIGNDNTIYLLSKNEKYSPMHIDKSEILEVWEVWKIIKRKGES